MVPGIFIGAGLSGQQTPLECQALAVLAQWLPEQLCISSLAAPAPPASPTPPSRLYMGCPEQPDHMHLWGGKGGFKRYATLKMRQRTAPRLLQLRILVVSAIMAERKAVTKCDQGPTLIMQHPCCRDYKEKNSPLISGMFSCCSCQPVSSHWDLHFRSITSSENGCGIKALIQIFPQISRKFKSGLKLVTSGPLLNVNYSR